ncbi:type VI secretion system protein TssA [Thiocapsa bogorovii]|uniref:type VI secretion system protein TssA n=1 Tax=Thiocapsa bogorovii TaxID=521689 RepID=UPI001E2F88E3|nr:type VI secretion system protein TssA [Thiocapsa bogorovii]UHD16124.1 type VI secretion system protein TssA [Thiocapsa bogorovii]
MPVIDVDALLTPVSAEMPAGEDREYDPAFLEVMRLAAGTPERVMGNTVVPAEQPDWQRVQSACVDILLQSKDLRIATLLLRALIRTSSLPGLQAGIQVLVGIVDRYWDQLYPSLDASDDNDATERISVLATLTDPTVLLTPLRDAPLIRSRTFGPLSLRDIELAEGKSKPPSGVTPLDTASVHAAFMDCDLDELASHAIAAASASEQIRALSASLGAHVQAMASPDFDALLTLLSSIETTLRARLNERRPADAAPDADSSAHQPSSVSGHGGSGRMSSSNADSMQITGRDDVVRVLDAVCAYYTRSEPSSPVPLLLKRARRLATMDFLAIMNDLVPEALDKVTAIKGPDS